MGRFYFNPHEREARDETYSRNGIGKVILIHTSVKLVTANRGNVLGKFAILIHTSVKLVTPTHSVNINVLVF